MITKLVFLKHNVRFYIEKVLKKVFDLQVLLYDIIQMLETQII